MKWTVLALAMISLLLLCCTQVDKGSVIQGRLIGADGRVPPLAHVHILGLGDALSRPIESVAVKEDGSFRLEVPGDRYYEMLVTAVNHQPLRVPLLADQGFRLAGVEVRPAPYDYRDRFDDLRIIGSWNNFNYREAQPMVPLDDGTFVYDAEVNGDTLAYQLVNALASGRTINGTNSDYYLYDGGGDYISVLRATGDTVRVIFDPDRARMATSEGLPRVDWGDPEHPLTKVWDIQMRWDQEAKQRDLAFQRYLEEHGSYDGFEYDAADLRAYLASRMAGPGNPTARRFAAVKLASLGGMGVPLTDQEILDIQGLLPLTDGMWADDPVSLVYVFARLPGSPEMIRLFEQSLDRVVDRKVRTVMLLEIGMRAKEMGDSARLEAIYNDLTENYGDINLPYVQYRIQTELNPNLRISAGRPLPDFEASLLDGQGVVSKNSMLGKYYLIDFWATWCSPCVAEMPNLERAHEQFAPDGFEILSMSLDGSQEDIKEFRAEKWKMPWLHVFLEGGFGADLAMEFEVTGIPKPILVSPEGIILATGEQLRGGNLEAVLARYLGKREPS